MVPPRVDLVIFGASGDLAQRKILPSLKRLASPDGMTLRVIGAGRTAQSTTHFRDIVKKRSGSQRLAATAEWARVDYKSPSTFAGLKKLAAGADHLIFYMATPPETASAPHSLNTATTSTPVCPKTSTNIFPLTTPPPGNSTTTTQPLTLTFNIQ